MFDAEIVKIIRSHQSDRDRVPYTRSRPSCRKVTYAPPGLVAITCGHCGRIDLGTADARQQWREKVKLANIVHPGDVLMMVVGITLLASVML